MIPSSACQPGRADQPGNAGSTATKAASYTTRWDTIQAFHNFSGIGIWVIHLKRDLVIERHGANHYY